MLSQRSYRIGSDQGIVILAAAVSVREASALPNRRYQYAVTLESLILIRVNHHTWGQGKLLKLIDLLGVLRSDRLWWK
jgi:hypothetical protein